MTDEPDHPRQTGEQSTDLLPNSVREGLRQAMTPLATTTPAASSDDIAPVVDRVADADVIGLGECTHGTREFIDLKHRILRHLVIEHGVRAVALESNLPETMALHDYVVHGEGTPHGALAQISYGPWQVESILELVEWLRTFNADRPLEDRVRIFGFGGHLTHGAVERLQNHLSVVDPDFLDDIRADLAAIDDSVEQPKDDQPGADAVHEWIDIAERVVATLDAHFADHREAHVDATSAESFARAPRYVRVLEQVLTKHRALDGFEGDVRDPTEYLRRMRNAGLPGGMMADNVAWIRDHTDADTLVVWASDAHLNRVAFTFPDADATAPSLGRRLAERHGNAYYVVGFSFAHGSFRAVDVSGSGEPAVGVHHLDDPLAGTIEEALSTLDEPLAFVDLRTAGSDPRTADWLAEPRNQFRIGGSVDPTDPRSHLVAYVYPEAFDGLCFVTETTGTRPLDGTQDTGGEGGT